MWLSYTRVAVLMVSFFIDPNTVLTVNVVFHFGRKLIILNTLSKEYPFLLRTYDGTVNCLKVAAFQKKNRTSYGKKKEGNVAFSGM